VNAEAMIVLYCDLVRGGGEGVDDDEGDDDDDEDRREDELDEEQLFVANAVRRESFARVSANAAISLLANFRKAV
jgi:hypothetical protein